MKQLLILLWIVPLTLFGQKYQHGTILFNSGKTLDCLLTPPSNPEDKKIETKISEDADKVTYKSEELKSITIPNKNYPPYVFVWESTKKLTGGIDHCWLVKMVEGYATLYGSSNGFKITKKGELELIGISAGHSSAEFYFYARRPDEGYVTMLGLYSPGTFGLNNFFRKASAKYFNDSPEIVKRINSKEFKIADISLVVSEYNEWKTEQGGK